MKPRAVVLTATGVIVVAFGLLFLVGAGGQARRVAIGCAGLGLGAVAVGVGVRNYKRAELWSPEHVRAEILDSARHKNGELAMADIEARLGRRFKVAGGVLENLQLEGVARPGHKEGERYFVFPHLQPRLMVRFCRYCDAEFPVSEERGDCPNCGGVLETQVATRSISEGEVFSMEPEGGPPA